MSFPVPEFGYYQYGSTVVRDYLLTRVPVPPYVIATLVPVAPRPAQLIVTRSAITSSAGLPIILSKRRQIIWCYDLSETQAVDTAEMVRGYLIEAMFTRGSGIRRTVIVGEPCYFPDPDDSAKTPRAQLTVDITLRAGWKAPT